MKASPSVCSARSVSRSLAAALVLGALATSPAAAQTVSRPGFWMDAGIGYGRIRLTCVTCSSIVAATGAAYTVAAGAAVSQNVVLGVQGELWQSSSAPRQQVTTVVAMAQWYPWPAAKLWVRGGVGVVRGSVALTADTTAAHSTQGTGVALTLGAGYDFRLSPHFAVALQAATNIAALGDLVVGGATANDAIAYVSRISVALVYR